METFQVINIKGEVVKTFPSKNQAEKYKKELKNHGVYGLKVVKGEK